MNFGSDTTAPAHPRVLEALARANTGTQPSYGDDAGMSRVRTVLAQTFETEDFDFWLVASGTAANAIALACLCPSTGAILCHREAHIERDERGAPGFFTGGAQLRLVPGFGARIDPAAFAAAVDEHNPGFVHETPVHAVSLTNLTECGTAYQPAEIAAFVRRASGTGFWFHLDGARLGNALVSTGASPAEMSWKAGIDVLTLGLTKTGAMGCEIILLFGKARDKMQELRIRAKRAGHMPAKMRYLSAQAEAMLTGGLWLELAGHANAMAQELAGAFTEAGVDLAYPPDGNEVFALLGAQDGEALKAAGARFYAWPGGSSRFVCSWATSPEEIAVLRAVLNRPQRV
ncbi:MAG: beta-eliminating lyase-related protein [Hyphomonas sp.]|uniref:low specificity L-threonine aldolase n=1 Tax=Hyphomonas sp. TaxID=87 RepID=UPI0034A0392B